MTGRSDLTIFAELDLDASRYTAAQQKLLREATRTTLNIEQNFRSLGIKSSAEFDLMRRKVQNSFDMIAASSKATANDILRAEKAKAAQLQRINEQQYGKQIRFIDDLKTHWKGYLTTIIGIGYAAKQVIDASLQMERITSTMNAVTGSAEQTAGALSFVRSEAQRLGLQMDDTALAYGKFMAASRGTTLEGANAQHVFVGVSEAVAALKLPTEQANGIFLALSQMLSKGKVQAEELRGQLGERLPGAFRLAADAMGVSTAELDKMLMGGKVMAEDLLPKLAVKLHETYGGAAVEAAQGGQAAINRFNNAIFETKAAVGDALMPVLSDALGLIAQAAPIIKDFVGGLKMTAVETYGIIDKIALLMPYAAGGSMPQEVRDRLKQIDQTVAAQKQSIYNSMAGTGAAAANARSAISKGVAGGGTASGSTGAGGKAAATAAYLESTRNLLAPYQADEDWAQYFEGYVKAQEELKKKAEERYGTEQQWSYDTTQKLLANARKVQSVSEDVWDKQGYYFLLTGEKTKEANAQILQQMIDDYEKTFVGGWQAGLLKIEQYQKTWGDVTQNMALQTYRAMSETFSDVFYDAVTGKMSSIEDYWKKMSKNILRSFTDLIGDMAAEKIMLYFKSEWTTGGADVLSIVSKVLGVAGNLFNDFGGGDYLGSSSSTYLSLARGGFVGGGDSVLNDTVPAMLSPGEFVVPRSVVASVASKGQQGDTMLAHINPTEAGLLKALGGSGTINPQTGLPQFFNIKDVLNIATWGGYGMLTGKWGHLGKMWSFLNPVFVAAYKASKSHNVWDLIDAVFVPDAITTLLGAVGGVANKLLPWVGDLIESILPTVGGMVGAVFGGPGGAAGGAAAGSIFASKWNQETNEQALQKAAITAAITYVAQGAGKYVGGATGSKVAGSAASMATGYSAKYIINAALGDKLAKDEIALGQLAISYAGSNDGGMLSYLSGAMKGMSGLVHPVSARNGLYYVPADNYPISAHKGEAVLNKREADAWRGGGVTVIINGNVVDHDKFAREMVPAITKAVRAGVH